MLRVNTALDRARRRKGGFMGASLVVATSPRQPVEIAARATPHRGVQPGRRPRSFTHMDMPCNEFATPSSHKCTAECARAGRVALRRAHGECAARAVPGSHALARQKMHAPSTPLIASPV